MSPHIKEGHEKDISVLELFKKMPGAFPGDEPELFKNEPKLSPEKEAERQRRMAIPRLQRPR